MRLSQPTNRRLRERLVCEISQRVPSPKPERRTESVSRASRIAVGKRPASLGAQGVEPNRVDLLRLDRKPVAAPLGHDRVGTKRLAQLRDVHLHCLGGGRRGSIAPQLIDQLVDRDRLAPLQDQHSQQRPLLGRAERDQLLVPHNLQRPKNPVLHSRLPF